MPVVSTRPVWGDGPRDEEEYRRGTLEGARRGVSELAWPSRYEAPRAWSVFAESGDRLGDVVEPDGVTLREALGDRVLGTSRDELGVDYVGVYGLAPESRGTSPLGGRTGVGW